MAFFRPASRQEVRDRYLPYVDRFDGEDFESILERVYSAWLSEGSWALDVGAHHGRHALLMARLADLGRVLAFEADPQSAELLRIRAAEGSAPQLEVHAVALGNEVGSQTFFAFDGTPELGGLRDRPDLGRSTPLAVPQTTVDRLELERLDFMKIDVEGAELQVLEGAKQTLGRARPMIAMEFGRGNAGERYGFTAEDFFSFLDRVEYRVYDIFGTRLLAHCWWPAEVWMPWNFLLLPRELGEPRWLAELLDPLNAAATSPPTVPPAAEGTLEVVEPSRADLFPSELLGELHRQFHLSRRFLRYYLLKSLRHRRIAQLDLPALQAEPQWPLVSYALNTRARGEERARAMVPHTPAPRRMLHIGCEYGGSLAAFAEQGFEVVGVESRLELARFSLLHLRAAGLEGRVHSDPSALAAEAKGSFGVAVLSDHGSQGCEAVSLERAARRLLSRGGCWELSPW